MQFLASNARWLNYSQQRRRFVAISQQIGEGSTLAGPHIPASTCPPLDVAGRADQESVSRSGLVRFRPTVVFRMIGAAIAAAPLFWLEPDDDEAEAEEVPLADAVAEPVPVGVADDAGYAEFWGLSSNSSLVA